MQLYNLTSQFKEVQELDPEIIGDTLDAISLEIDEKIKNIAFVVKNLEAKAKACGDEADRLKAEKQTAINTIDRLKTYAREAMAASEKKTIDCGLFKVTRTAARDMVQIDNEDVINATASLGLEFYAM